MVTTGFIRVRRRKLKPKYEWYTPSRGMYAGISRKREIPNSAVEVLNYDLVRAVRINGQPRHKFVLGFGSPVSKWSDSTVGFWMRVLEGTASHGFTKDQQFQVADQLRRKGIPLPTLKECKAAKAKTIEWNAAYPAFASSPEKYDAVIAFIRHSNRKGGEK